MTQYVILPGNIMQPDIKKNANKTTPMIANAQHITKITTPASDISKTTSCKTSGTISARSVAQAAMPNGVAITFIIRLCSAITATFIVDMSDRAKLRHTPAPPRIVQENILQTPVSICVNTRPALIARDMPVPRKLSIVPPRASTDMPPIPVL